jgi:hypothetical protein
LPKSASQTGRARATKLRELDKNREPSRRDAGRRPERSQPRPRGGEDELYPPVARHAEDLSGHAWTDGQGFVRVRNPKGTIRGCVERSDLNDLFDEGWVLDDAKLE